MWTEPKTNWTSNDYYNAEDYNRILNNIEWLKRIADKLVANDTVITKTYLYSIPALVSTTDKTYTDFTFANVLNALETNLSSINTNTHDLSFTPATFVKNGTFINYIHLNNIEETIRQLHELLLHDNETMRKTQFTLSNDFSQKGVRL